MNDRTAAFTDPEATDWAGQAAGGDSRGMQSAAMLIVKEAGGVWLNNDIVLRLQVDDNAEPIKELRRLVEIAGERRRRR